MSNQLKYQNLQFFPKLIRSYLDQKEEVKPLYNLFPTLENFINQINSRSKQEIDRETLAHVLQNQYKDLNVEKIVTSNIDKLLKDNTFTITTGHQLNLFLGPVYFIYKIISTIKLAKQLAEKYPENNFVPIFWMASEDHDFEEINHFYLSASQKISWNKNYKSAVGKLQTNDLDEVYEDFSDAIGNEKYAEELRRLFKKAYLQNENLSDATRILVNELFGRYGLIIIDADNRELKNNLIPILKKELQIGVIYKNVNETNLLLKDNLLETQVNPREINLFYHIENARERIVKIDENYHVLNTSIYFSYQEIENEIENNPEKFSPNVLLRPLYQELILPNLAVVGGSGEMSYWLQLKSSFDFYNIVFPMIVIRNSVLWINEKQQKKWKKLGLDLQDIFSGWHDISNKITNINEPKNKPDFQFIYAEMEKNMEDVAKWTRLIEPTYEPGINATLHKQINEWKNWEHKLHKTIKKKNVDSIERAEIIYKELFPNGILQERVLNFSSFFLAMGPDFIENLIKKCQPLAFEFDIYSMDNQPK